MGKGYLSAEVLSVYSTAHTHIHINTEECPRGVMVKATDCGIVVSKFVIHSHYYVDFWTNTFGKGMNPLIIPAMV